MTDTHTIRWFKNLGMADVPLVGGKNASLGEMTQHLESSGVKVPNGFATTADAYWDFLRENDLEKKIKDCLANLDTNDLNQLTAAGTRIRNWILEGTFSQSFIADIRAAYATLAGEGEAELSFAVRSSATAEDLPEASFAGQQETFLNVRGLDSILMAIKHVFASLYNDRAITYRVHHGFAHHEVALSAGVQRMVRSDCGVSGVMFTIDTESGFNQVVFITSSYGLGEAIVQGAVNPDEFYVYKPNILAKKPAVVRRTVGDKRLQMVFESSEDFQRAIKTVPVSEEAQRRFSLTDAELETLADYAIKIENHYGCPMDIEWAKDGIDQQLYILQARPETVKSREKSGYFQRFELTDTGKALVTGRAIGQRIGQGTVKIVSQLSEMHKIQEGDVLVADMTDPDWEPVMKKASAIVTNRGGRTCHAAIIARELGIPAVVGCTDATKRLTEGEKVTVSCAEGDTGVVYQGLLEFKKLDVSVASHMQSPVKLSMNVAHPDRAFSFQNIPNQGVGLARLEFIISNTIGIHPRALLEFEKLPEKIQNEIEKRCAAYPSKKEFYIQRLTEGVASIACAFAGKPVIVRLSDFKSNEYANLLGGRQFEPEEENPMIGFRGASRYVSPHFRDCFALECEAIKRVRNELGFNNVEIMIPFVRTVTEAKAVCEELAKQGLVRGKDDLRIIMMCEVPSNALLADEFLEYFDGYSIGSNDLTQLTLGLDRDSALVAQQFDERNDAVKALISMAITACKRANKYIGICGQGPSDHLDLAFWLIDQGIDALSLNPDSVLPLMAKLTQKHQPAPVPNPAHIRDR